MSLREQNKARNRRRILRAGQAILRQEGIEQLSMRRLADRAKVSLRTPYNLFGSKTDVLLALLQEPFESIALAAAEAHGDDLLDQMLAFLERAYREAARDEAYLRAAYWAVMRSDQRSARDAAIAAAWRVAKPLVEDAVATGELRPDLDAGRFARHLVIVAVALIGMWAGSQLTLDEAREHITWAWSTSLLSQATADTRADWISVRPALERPPLHTDPETTGSGLEPAGQNPRASRRGARRGLKGPQRSKSPRAPGGPRPA